MNRFKALAGAAVLVALTATVGCSTPAAPTTPNEAGAAPSTPAPRPERSSTGPTVDANGHVLAVVSVSNGIEGADGSSALDFTVTEIERDPICDGPEVFYTPSENGQFIAFDMTITTAPDYLEAMAGKQPLRLDWSEWFGYRADGSQVDNTSAGFGCLATEAQFPLEIPAGQATSARWVLDLPADVVSVAWEPTYITSMDDIKGWAWQLP